MKSLRGCMNGARAYAGRRLHPKEGCLPTFRNVSAEPAQDLLKAHQCRAHRGTSVSLQKSRVWQPYPRVMCAVGAAQCCAVVTVGASAPSLPLVTVCEAFATTSLLVSRRGGFRRVRGAGAA